MMSQDEGWKPAEGEGSDAIAWLRGRLDRYGGDFARWTVAAEAQRARQMVLAEPEARRLWEEAKTLDRLLVRDRDNLDAGLAESVARVDGAVMAALPAEAAGERFRRPLVRRLAVGMAAAWFFGIGLGAVGSELPIFAQPDTVELDSWIFGPEEFDLS